MRKIDCYAALIAAVLCLAARAPAGDAPTSATLTISALSLVGEPLPGVAFKVAVDDDSATTVTTNSGGMARVELHRAPAAGDDPAVLADARYRSAGVVVTRATGSRRMVSFHRIFPAALQSMSDAERLAYIRELPGILSHARSTGTPIPAGELHPLRISAMLTGVRHAEEALDLDRDAAAAMDAAEDVLARGPSITARVLSLYGQPVEGRVVELVRMKAGSATVEIVGRERSRAGGEVYFPLLERGPLYRVIVSAEGDGLSAASAPVAVEEKGTTTVPPIILQPAERRLSGLVYRGDGPAVGAEVSSGGENQPRLAAVTDRFGYFELAPLKEGTVSVSIHPGPGRRAVSVTVPLDGIEVLIPLELLEPSGPGK